MNAALLNVMAQYELMLWLRNQHGWVRDAELMAAMDLPRQDIAELRRPLAERGYVQTCLGACQLTEHGRQHAADILDDLVAATPG